MPRSAARIPNFCLLSSANHGEPFARARLVARMYAYHIQQHIIHVHVCFCMFSPHSGIHRCSAYCTLCCMWPPHQWTYTIILCYNGHCTADGRMCYENVICKRATTLFDNLLEIYVILAKLGVGWRTWVVICAINWCGWWYRIILNFYCNLAHCNPNYLLIIIYHIIRPKTCFTRIHGEYTESA